MKRIADLIVVAAFLAPLDARPAELNAEQALFRSIYQELIEINTTDSSGDTTAAAKAMGARLLAAGFKPSDVEVIPIAPRKGNLLARYRGSGAKKPMLLLAHLDVVEARREDWKTDPFKLQETNGYFIARGAIDDKAMAAIFVSVFGQLLKEGFKPSRDIVLALTADEEIDSTTNGAQWLVVNRRKDIDVEFGINEGGRGELDKAGKRLSNVVSFGEKTYVHVELEATGPGGHSARPTVDNTIYDLADALQRLRAHAFPVRLNEPARAYFERSASLHAGQTALDMRALAQPNPDPAAVERLSKVPNIVGLLRTTCVSTMLEAGHAPNALAQRAKAVVNCRVLPEEDLESVRAKLVEIAGPRVQVNFKPDGAPAPSSPLLPGVMAAIEATTAELWPGVPVIPTMLVATTDSRFFRGAGIPMYGVSGLFVDPSATGVQGLDERIPVQSLYEGREFLYRLVKRLAQ